MSKPDMPASTIEKTYSIGILKSLYLLTYCRLGKEQFPGGAGKAAGKGNLLKGAELVNFHKKRLWEPEPLIICILS